MSALIEGVRITIIEVSLYFSNFSDPEMLGIVN